MTQQVTVQIPVRSKSGRSVIAKVNINLDFPWVELRPGDDIQSAINAYPEGQSFRLGSGVYRQPGAFTPKRRQVFWSDSGAIITGAIPVVNWTQQGLFWYTTNVLPPDYVGPGLGEDEATNPQRRAENLFRDGWRLHRVMSHDALAPGSYYADYTANLLWVADDPTGHRFNLARTPLLVNGTAPEVRLIGLTFAMCANPAQDGAVRVSAPDWELSGIMTTLCHGAGIKLEAADRAWLHDGASNENGQIGVACHNSQSVCVERYQLMTNNTDGFWIADWEAGGLKATLSSISVLDSFVLDNLGPGLWFDIDCKTVLAQRNAINDNAADGVRYEISYDGKVLDNDVRRNGNGLKGRRGVDNGGLFFTAGLNVNAAQNVELARNCLDGNANAVSLQSRKRNPASGKYGVYSLGGINSHHNRVKLDTPTDPFYLGRTGSVVETGAPTMGSVVHSKNRYLVPAAKTAGAKLFTWQGANGTFVAWQAAGQDTDGALTLF